MLDFILRWSERARSLVRANIIWNSSVHLQEQIRMYQVGEPPTSMLDQVTLRALSFIVSMDVSAIVSALEVALRSILQVEYV